MENIYKKIEKDLHSLSTDERNEILSRLRKEVDFVDKELVRLLSKRTLHSVLIGRVKRSMGLATYSPQREKDVSKKVSSFAEEPLRPEAVLRIYERILDESRAIQREEANKGNLYKIFNSRDRIPFNKLLSRKEFLIVFFLFISLMTWFYWIFFSPNYYSGEEPKVIKITKGMSFGQVTDTLIANDVVKSKIAFKIAGFIYDAESNIKSARYKIPNGLSYLDLLDMLKEGRGDQLREVKIYNGISLKGLQKKLKAENIILNNNIDSLLKSQTTIRTFDPIIKSLEGYFLPGYYHFYENSETLEILQIMNDSLRVFISDTLISTIKRKGLSIHSVLTMASIIEGETNLTEEMPTISGVYYNRLKIGMRLQADPTLQYLQEGGWKRLLYSDLKIDSPYNTYKYIGLPPGPINNPGKQAILAAIFPQDNNYIFFVANGMGGHMFARNYSEHLKNVSEYRKWLKTQKK
ncbi:MAG: endolytic transglycosylase MltG [Ignavibacteria bacterium]|nr:endolytic transglycosylase MltG [Ignavibacteria bacterium]